MNTIRQALQSYPYHFIALIGRTRGLRLSSTLHKAQLIDKVNIILCDPAHTAAILSQLSPLNRQVLDTVLLAKAPVLARHLTRLYGVLRTPRHIIQAHRQQQPLSDLEQLILWGICFTDSASQTVFIPADLRPCLPKPTLPTVVPPATTPDLSPLDIFCYDLTTLLALLQTEQINLVHSRWLPPSLLNQWGQHCYQPPLVPTPRSELQTNRRRFIHYLAENAGLVTGADNYGITLQPKSWLWLSAPRPQRIQMLWAAWSKAKAERWHQYRLPGYTWQSDPARLLPHLHQTLLMIDPADPQRFAQLMLKQQPNLLELVPGNSQNPALRFTETVVQLLTGPLLWLGLLHCQTSSDKLCS